MYFKITPLAILGLMVSGCADNTNHSADPAVAESSEQNHYDDPLFDMEIESPGEEV